LDPVFHDRDFGVTVKVCIHGWIYICIYVHMYIGMSVYKHIYVCVNMCILLDPVFHDRDFGVISSRYVYVYTDFEYVWIKEYIYL
jgi:hypothetical protein